MPQFGIEDKRPTITLESSNISEFLESNPVLKLLSMPSTYNASFYIDEFYSNDEYLSESEINIRYNYS